MPRSAASPGGCSIVQAALPTRLAGIIRADQPCSCSPASLNFTAKMSHVGQPDQACWIHAHSCLSSVRNGRYLTGTCACVHLQDLPATIPAARSFPSRHRAYCMSLPHADRHHIPRQCEVRSTSGAVTRCNLAYGNTLANQHAACSCF